MCHTGKVLGGQSFEKMGFYKDYFAERGNVGDADNGRFNVTKKELDRHKFKVPMLRNITLTFPYFHDGSTSDLKKVVEIMASHQLEDGLSGDEITAIVAFLQTLTGELAGQMLQ
jgi:cytochrome c peroxidase